MKSIQKKSAGFTLMELMVSMVIGMLIILAVGTLFVKNREMFVFQDQQANLMEDGRFVNGFFVDKIRNAGYQNRTNLFNPSNPAFIASSSFDSQSFVLNQAIAGKIDANNTSITYVRMMGDADGSILNCWGVALPAVAVAGAPYVMKLYVENNQLMCMDSPTVAVPTPVAVPLADNVRDFQVRYGVDADHATDPVQVANKYLKASDVAATDWVNVTSVKVCLLMTSVSNKVTQQPQPYVSCENVLAGSNTETTPTGADAGRLFRSFNQTIVLRNQVLKV